MTHRWHSVRRGWRRICGHAAACWQVTTNVALGLLGSGFAQRSCPLYPQ